MEQTLIKKRSLKTSRGLTPARTTRPLLTEARSYVLGISTGCPISSDKCNCLFNKLARLPLQERVSFVEDLNAEEISQILTCYRVCSMHSNRIPQQKLFDHMGDERL